MFSTADTLSAGGESDFQFALRTEGHALRIAAPIGRAALYQARLTSVIDGPGDPGIRPLYLAGKGKWRCIAPIPVLRRAAHKHSLTDDRLGEFYEAQYRCRKCDPCRKAHQSFWKLRAMAEIQTAVRTWFVTLTLSADQQAKADFAALLRLERRGVTRPTARELFAARFDAIAPEATRWLKRVRKARTVGYVSPDPGDHGEVCPPWEAASFRYLMVAEEHKSGLPHLHFLLHEKSGQTLTKRRLEHTWVAGFAKAKLVGNDDLDPHKAAAYVCKYLTKSMLARVRASHAYGVNS